MFHASVIATNAAMVVYGILFGGVHPVTFAFDLDCVSMRRTVGLWLIAVFQSDSFDLDCVSMRRTVGLWLIAVFQSDSFDLDCVSMRRTVGLWLIAIFQSDSFDLDCVSMRRTVGLWLMAVFQSDSGTPIWTHSLYLVSTGRPFLETNLQVLLIVSFLLSIWVR